ncbi:peptidoglycan recognition protein 1 [Fukomys damarensis]|nr:peptidoglycan recognition protein 1 [Fukomys damarensis]
MCQGPGPLPVVQVPGRRAPRSVRPSPPDRNPQPVPALPEEEAESGVRGAPPTVPDGKQPRPSRCLRIKAARGGRAERPLLAPRSLPNMSSHCGLSAWVLLALLGVAQSAGGQISCHSVVPRSEWKALASDCTASLTLPVRYVVISHTAGSTCDSPASCEEQARNVQRFHVRQQGWCDVGYNFLIGEDGHVYEGRGWNTKGAHSGPDWNSKSIGITFMGDYMERVPPKRALRAAQNLLACGVAQGALKSNYELKGHRDVQQTESPGDQLYEIIQSWSHYHQ